MSAWIPANLPAWVADLARAIDGRFVLRQPNQPIRVPQHPAASLTTEFATRHPYGLAINTGSKKLVISVLNAGGTAFEWVNADGSAL